MNRAVDLTEGRAFVVTDLHGDWNAYVRYRDHFLDLLERGEAEILVLLGDLIHGYGAAKDDNSLPMIWDVMELQKSLGSKQVLMLLGNHEIPHIYGVPLSKGDQSFTPRFEHALGEYRDSVIQFLKSLPFLARTHAGVMLTHAGASPLTATQDSAGMLLSFSHEDLLAEVDQLLNRDDILDLIFETLQMSLDEYNLKSWELLAVSGSDDPRYFALLRGFLVSNLEPEWSALWDFFFTQCEAASGAAHYSKILKRFLSVYALPEQPQTMLVTGHIPVKGGIEIIGEQQLRLASWSHSIPRESGRYLLFDTAKPLHSMDELMAHVHPMP